MKAFCISDVHARVGFLEAFDRYLSDRKSDCIFFTGDIVNQGRELGYLKKFDQIVLKHQIDMFWVPGNNDIGPVYELMKKRKYSVEDRLLQFEGENIVGMGGVPDLWGHNIYYPNIEKEKMKSCIFLSHIPPKNFKNFRRHDHDEIDESKKILNAPKIQISGHQHSYWGVGYIGETKVLKLPAGLNMMAAELDTKTLKVEFINITDYNKRNKVILR